MNLKNGSQCSEAFRPWYIVSMSLITSFSSPFLT